MKFQSITLKVKLFELELVSSLMAAVIRGMKLVVGVEIVLFHVEILGRRGKQGTNRFNPLNPRSEVSFLSVLKRP